MARRVAIGLFLLLTVVTGACRRETPTPPSRPPAPFPEPIPTPEPTPTPVPR